MYPILVGPQDGCASEEFWTPQVKLLEGVTFDMSHWHWSPATGKNMQGLYYTQYQGNYLFRHWFKLPGEVNKGGSMMKELFSDAKDLVKQHRQVIFWIIVLFVADHLFLKGTIKARLQGLAEKILGKLEKQVDKE